MLFLGHGAERSGPPLYLLRFLEWLASAGPADVPRPTVVLARGGELVPAYEAVADVVVASRGAEPAEPLAAALRRAGRPALAGAAGDRWLRRRLAGLGGHDVVHVNGCSPANARVLDALPASAAPVVLHVHELDIGLRHNLTDAQRADLFGRTDRFLAVAEVVVRTLTDGHGIAPERISLHPGFVDQTAIPVGRHPSPRAGLGIGSDAFLVGTAAFPEWRKAPDLLLRAAWSVRRRRPDIDLHVLWIGGDPSATDGWQMGHEARQLGLGDRFHHAAATADPLPLLAALDVYASTAREDAFPLAALEAAATGRPVVTFATGGVSELVAGDAGLVAPFPDTDAFADALISFHDDPAARELAGQVGARRVAERYSAERCGPALWAALVDAAHRP